MLALRDEHAHPPLGDGRALFSKFFVAQSHRGHGIGRALLSKAADVAREAGFLELELDTRPVFLAAIQSGLYILAVIAVLASVVGAVYYLKVIKVMLFDEPAPGFEPMSGELRAVLTASILFLVLFAVYPSPLVAAAEAAARSLIP